MAKTLLNGVNHVLTRSDVLDSGSTLSSLTDNARQTLIDLAVQVINETVDELYSLGGRSKPNQMKEATLTLVQNQRSYVLRSDLIRLRSEYPLVDETNSQYIVILDEDGYRKIIMGDLEQDDTGLPSYCAINPTNGRLTMDVLPDSNASGRVYKYRYDKEFSLEAAGDTFPFSDAVFRAVMSAATELWRLYRHQDFSPDVFRLSLGRAGRLLRQLPPSDSYRHMPQGTSPADPFEK